MENFLKIYIQKIQQNLKAVAFRTIQFFRARADFPPQNKNKPQRIFNDAISNRIEYVSSTIILLRKQFLWAQGASHLCWILQFALLAIIINFLFFSTKANVWIFIVI